MFGELLYTNYFPLPRFVEHSKVIDQFAEEYKEMGNGTDQPWLDLSFKRQITDEVNKISEKNVVSQNLIIFPHQQHNGRLRDKSKQILLNRLKKFIHRKTIKRISVSLTFPITESHIRTARENRQSVTQITNPFRFPASHASHRR